MTEETISKDLFDVLVCPVCKEKLEYTEGKKGLRCSKCNETYPIKDGIPVLLPKDLQ
jgi:LSD1 subclass zinc finger protein